MFNITSIESEFHLATWIRLDGLYILTLKVLVIFTMKKRSSNPIMHKLLNFNRFQRIFTDTDLYDRLFLQVIEQYIDIIETFIAGNYISIPEKTDLVLDIDLDSNGDYITDYYFANHPLRIIFFLDHFSSDYLPNWEEIKGVNSGRHLRMSSSCYQFLNGSFSFIFQDMRWKLNIGAKLQRS